MCLLFYFDERSVGIVRLQSSQKFNMIRHDEIPALVRLSYLIQIVSKGCIKNSCVEPKLRLCRIGGRVGICTMVIFSKPVRCKTPRSNMSMSMFSFLKVRISSKDGAREEVWMVVFQPESLI